MAMKVLTKVSLLNTGIFLVITIITFLYLLQQDFYGFSFYIIPTIFAATTLVMFTFYVIAAFRLKYFQKNGASQHAKVVSIKRTGEWRERNSVGRLGATAAARFGCTFIDKNGKERFVESRYVFVNRFDDIKNFSARAYFDPDKPERCEVVIFANSGNTLRL
jgi:hypothetical protein